MFIVADLVSLRSGIYVRFKYVRKCVFANMDNGGNAPVVIYIITRYVVAEPISLILSHSLDVAQVLSEFGESMWNQR